MSKKAQKILDAAAGQFLTSGVKKTTMDDIAEAAKASKMTIYKYFADKDTLYLKVGKSILADYSGRLRAVQAARTPLTERLYGAIEGIVAFADSGEYALCSELAAYNREIDAEIALYRQDYEAVLYDLIDEGIAAGRMKPGLDREMIFHYIDMGVAHYQQNAAYRTRMQDMAFQRRFMRFFIGGIFADGEALLPET